MPDNAAGVRSKIVKAVGLLLSALADRNDDALKDVFSRSRCEPEDVYRAMDEYGVAFAAPPPGAYEKIEIIKIDRASSLYAVDADFWDNEGQRTDLTAQLTIELSGNDAIIEIDGVRVM